MEKKLARDEFQKKIKEFKPLFNNGNAQVIY